MNLNIFYSERFGCCTSDYLSELLSLCSGCPE